MDYMAARGGSYCLSGSSAHAVAMIGYAIDQNNLISIRIMDPARSIGGLRWTTYSSTPSGCTFTLNSEIYYWEQTVRLFYS